MNPLSFGGECGAPHDRVKPTQSNLGDRSHSKYGVYTRVSAERDWIKGTISKRGE